VYVPTNIHTHTQIDEAIIQANRNMVEIDNICTFLHTYTHTLMKPLYKLIETSWKETKYVPSNTHTHTHTHTRTHAHTHTHSS
jgi:hypothetical protein